MTRTIRTLPGQTLFDIAIQEYGSMDGVECLVLDNLGDLFPEDSDILISKAPINERFAEIFTNLKPTSE